jgi:aminoglycoside 6'-N-acetyltransferase
MTAASYSFRAVTPQDLDLLRQWLHAPDVMRWWGDPGQEFTLIEEDLRNPAMAQWIVCLDARPFAYAQAYQVNVWPQAHFAFLPPGAIAIDAFIGEPALMNQGHGSHFLHLLAERLMQDGATAVAIDPGADNHRAIAAYRKAGFAGDTIVEPGEGTVVPMVFAQKPP